MIFFVCSVKTVFLFPTKMILAFYQKTQDNLLPKMHFRDDISGIIEKDDIHHRKYGISSDRKTKHDKKVYSIKYTQGELVRLM